MTGTTSGAQDSCPPGCYPGEGGREPPSRSQGRAHISPVRTLGLRRSSRFPPKPAPPQAVAIQASDEKAFFMSQSETHEPHSTGVSNRGAETGEGAVTCHQRNPP